MKSCVDIDWLIALQNIAYSRPHPLNLQLQLKTAKMAEAAPSLSLSAGYSIHAHLDAMDDADTPGDGSGGGAVGTGGQKRLRASPDIRSANVEPSAQPNAAALDHLIASVLGKQRLSPALHKNVSFQLSKLDGRIRKQLALHERIAKNSEAIRSLADGKLPNGIRPFKATVDSPYLDEPVPSVLATVSLDFSNMTVREAKEKLYLSQISIAKSLDNHVMSLQMEAVKTEITEEAFTAACTVSIFSKSEAASSIASKLGICVNSSKEVEDETKLTHVQCHTLFVNLLEKIGLEEESKQKRIDNQKNQFKKLVEEAAKLSPKDLLDKAIESKVASVMKKKEKSNGSGKIDLLGAYVHNEEFVEDPESFATIAAPPGLPKPKPKAKPKPKPKPKSAKDSSAHSSSKNDGGPPVNKDSGTKGKGKGKNKDKGKGKGKKEGKSEPKGGKKTTKGKGKGKQAKN